MTDREEAAALSEADRALCGRLEKYTGYVGQHADIVQLTTLVRTLSLQLHAAEADAARLAEALGAYYAEHGCSGCSMCTPATEALAAHTIRLIDG